MKLERRDGYWLLVGGPVPRGADGITLGPLVVVRSGRERSELLLRHEEVHVEQWRRLGWVRFYGRYLLSYLAGRLHRRGHRGAYLQIPFEVEADWISRRDIARRR
ncbi:MAG: hypothetical protein R2705_08175 [Ilumatobacteraceae bacterium]